MASKTVTKASSAQLRTSSVVRRTAGFWCRIEYEKYASWVRYGTVDRHTFDHALSGQSGPVAPYNPH